MILYNPYMSPAGEKVLWMVVLLLVVFCVLWIRRAYRRWKYIPLRIKKKVWYSGGLKMTVTVRNIRNTMVEIDTPILEFRQPRMKKRKYRIVEKGEKNLFPLCLMPKTDYDFKVEFNKLYERDEILRQYRQVIIHINNVRGKSINKKKIKISLPK